MNNKTLSIIIAAEDKASKTMTSVGSHMENVAAKIATATKVAAAATGAAIAAVATASVKSTARLEQSIGGALSVFGDWSLDLEERARDSYSVMGTSMNQYLETANKMGSLFQGAGFSVSKSFDLTTDAMQRATDVATAMGISTEMALESIAGAAKGNFTMMDNLGVAMNDTTLNAYALEKGIGKTTQQMTNAEKVGLAMQLFMEKTAKYAGNYAKENETLAGSVQTVKGAWDNYLSGVEGGGEQLAKSLTNMTKVYAREIPKIVKTLINSTGEMYQELKNSSPEFRKYATMAENAFNTVIQNGKTALNVIKSLAPAIGGVVGAFVAYRTVVAVSSAITTAHSALIFLMGTRYVMLNGQLVAVKGAVTALTVAQGLLNNVMKMNPVGLFMGALTLLAGVMIQVQSGAGSTKGAQDRLNTAFQVGKTAADNLRLAEKELSDSRLAVEGSALAVERAQRNYNDAVAQYGPNSLEAREAAYELKRAQDGLRDANDKVREASKRALEEQNKVKEAKDAIIKAQNEVAYATGNSAAQWERLRNASRDAIKAQEEIKKQGGISTPTQQLKAAGFPTMKTGFATGGYTGRGGANEIAGVVHKGEYVVPKSQVDQSTGTPKISGGDININILGTMQMNNQSDIETLARRISDIISAKNELGSYGAGI